MSINRTFRIVGMFVLLVAVIAASAAYFVSAVAKDSENKSNSEVYWWWDDEGEVVGESKLIRKNDRIIAKYEAAGLPANTAVTLWYIIFNTPDGCSTDPCSMPEDIFNPDANADFLFAGGVVVDDKGRVKFNNTLMVGDTSGSGLTEIDVEGFEAIGLLNPGEAEVVLAAHSHGTVVPELLEQQLSSYLGGCVPPFLGTNGFADGPDDVPNAIGDCSTVQRSLHQ